MDNVLVLVSFVLDWTWCTSLLEKKRALILVGLSVLRFEFDLVLYVVIWRQCSLFLFGLDVHCFGLSMPARINPRKIKVLNT